MQSNDNLQRIRSSSIPPFVLQTTLKEAGYPALRTIVEKSEFKLADGWQSYSLVGATKVPEDRRGRGGVYDLGKSEESAARATAIFAKELVLSRAPLMFYSLSGLARELSDPVLYNEDRSTLPPLGYGYIAIPDFDHDDSIKDGHELARVLDWLVQHVTKGGGLILGMITSKPLSTYSTVFGLLQPQFREIAVATA